MRDEEMREEELSELRAVASRLADPETLEEALAVIAELRKHIQESIPIIRAAENLTVAVNHAIRTMADNE